MEQHENGHDVLPAAQVPKDLKVRTGVNYEFLVPALQALANPDRLHLLAFLTQPHYLEEIASEMKVTRQAARKHLDKLVEVGILERRPAVRESGPVTEFVLNPQALFLVHDEFEKMGSLRRREGPRRRGEPPLTRTLVAADPRAGTAPLTVPCFLVVRGMDTGVRHALEHNERRAWTIGRDRKCDVVVGHDPYASNRHAEVHRGSLGLALVDLGSTNGTVHNLWQLPRGAEVPLRHGDLVGIGKSLLLYWEPGGPR